MSDNCKNEHSCTKNREKKRSKKCETGNEISSTYCQEFSKPPWTKPADESADKYGQIEQKRNEKKACEDEEYGMQYLAKQKAGQGKCPMENDECSNTPNPCCPQPCVPQPKQKKYKKRPIQPFATTDQLRDKIFGYIENQPNPTHLRPFRGYRDDIVRQQLCCSDDLVTNPPDPCPPEDPCDRWNEILRTCNMQAKEAVLCEVNALKDKMPCGLSDDEQLNFMPCLGASADAICAFKDQIEAAKKAAACTCPPSKCPPAKCGTPRSEKSPCQSQKTNTCSASKATKKCQNTASERAECLSVKVEKGDKCKKTEPKVANNCQSDDLADIIEYCKQIKGETAAMLKDTRVGAEEEVGDQGEEGNYTADTDINPTVQHYDENGEYEPDPELRCEEELSDEEDEEDYHNHPMFGGPDPTPKRTMKEEMKMYKVHVANIRKRYFGEMMRNIDDIDTITPDIAAAMVYSEELGLKIKSAPQTAYDYLYPEVPSQPVLSIGHVTESAPRGIDDIVVPLAPPMMLNAAEFPGLEDPAMLDHPRILQVMPSMNLVEEPKASDTMPANDICELVTGTTHVNMMTLLFPEYEGMEQLDADEEEEDQRFNIKLNPSIPAHFSQMQIRGSEPPTWFPGYYVALPSRPDVLTERKYGSILEKVWEEVQPEFVSPGGGAAIIGS